MDRVTSVTLGCSHSNETAGEHCWLKKISFNYQINLLLVSIIQHCIQLSH